MPTSVKQLLAEANAAIPRITPSDARKLVADEDALFVDVRDGTEVAQTGKLQGAINVSRGMIEFIADENADYYNAAFRKKRYLILYCASGGRSALAGKALKEMGYERVYTLGTFEDAVDAGLPIEMA